MLFVSHPLQPILPKPSLSSLWLSLIGKFSVLCFPHRPLEIHSLLDAAQSKIAPDNLKIAIIGFGNYGQFLAKTLVRQGHTVLAHSQTNHSQVARQLGIPFFPEPNYLFEQNPEIVLLSTSIISTEFVLKSLPLHRLKPNNTLFVDVLSVKEYPNQFMLNILLNDFDILCTHPMFGPQSARHNLNGFDFVYEKVRISNEESRISRCDKFLNIFAEEGCRMVEMSCADHDRYVALPQFVTHTTGRLLNELKLESTPINTKGYEALLGLVENTVGDSFDLCYGLFRFTDDALEMLVSMYLAFCTLKKQLQGGPISKEHYSVPKHVRSGVAMRSLNADPPTDNKAQIFNCLDVDSKLRIAIIGFGNFGQFLAKTIVRQGHTVLAYSRSDYSDVAQKLGVQYFSNGDDLCEEHPEVVLLCTSILSAEKVLRSLPVQRLKRNTLFVDVLSVKEFPRNLFLQNLPPCFDILCTHPMFGPESGKNGWNSLPFVYDKVRIGSDQSRVLRCDRFLDIFAREGCRMVEMTCSEHDKHAAGSQFITHTMGRVLEKLRLESTPIKTNGYETLMKLVENTAGDSYELYYGLFVHNVNASEQLDRLNLAFKSLIKQLFRFSGIHQKQLSENADESLDFQETFLSIIFKILFGPP